MSKSELRNAAMKGEKAPEFGGAGIAQVMNPDGKWPSETQPDTITTTTKSAAMDVTSNAMAGYPRPDLQEAYRRRGELLKLVLVYLPDNLRARIADELKEG